MNYSDRHTLYPGIVIISYNIAWGGNIRDRWMWMGELNCQVYDYDTKEHLIAKANAEGLESVVLRVHRDGTASQQSVVRTPRRSRCSCFGWDTDPFCVVHGN